MKRYYGRARFRAHLGWLKWMPILFLLFVMLFCDAWLNIRKWQTDYERARLSAEERELRGTLDGLRAEEAGLRAVQRLATIAPGLALIEPQPDLITMLEYRPTERIQLPETAQITVARYEATQAATAPLSAALEIPDMAVPAPAIEAIHPPPEVIIAEALLPPQPSVPLDASLSDLLASL